MWECRAQVYDDRGLLTISYVMLEISSEDFDKMLERVVRMRGVPSYFCIRDGKLDCWPTPGKGTRAVAYNAYLGTTLICESPDIIIGGPW